MAEKKTKKVEIYETKGRAREYSELAMNLYDSCSFSCAYCYVPMVLHRKEQDFHKTAKPRITAGDIEISVGRWLKTHPDEKRSALLSFTSDPYQPIEMDTKLTRQTIEILHAAGLNVTILTKGGNRALRDFDLLRPGDAFAVTLTCLDETETEYWEPGAAPTRERLHTLSVAHNMGIETWVSFEPVLYPEETMALIKATKDYVDHIKVGTLNYHEHADTIDWRSFGWSVKAMMDGLEISYYLKADLRYAMGIKHAGGSAGPQSKQATADHVAGLVSKHDDKKEGLE
jgi:DNA repair photolyase